MNRTLCIYHKACPDGFAAAWVVGQNLGFENVEFHAATYGDPVPALDDREVYIVDFSWSPEKLLPAIRQAKQVFLLDHHQTALQQWTPEVLASCSDKLQVTLDPEHAGAIIAWQHFRPNSAVPAFLSWLEDYDLWRKKIPHSEAAVIGLKATGIIQREDWNGFGHLMQNESNQQRLLDMGYAVQSANRLLIQGILERSTSSVSFMGHQVLAANVPYEFRDQAGELLYKKAGPFSITYDDWRARGVRKYSLRAAKETAVDVEVLARRFGGGGHRTAAGFEVPLAVLSATYPFSTLS